MAFDSVGRDGERHASAEQAIGPYLRAIRRHWILVAVVTVLAGVIAGYTASHGGKTYQASSSILVSPLPEGQSARSASVRWSTPATRRARSRRPRR